MTDNGACNITNYTNILDYIFIFVYLLLSTYSICLTLAIICRLPNVFCYTPINTNNISYFSKSQSSFETMHNFYKFSSLATLASFVFYSIEKRAKIFRKKSCYLAFVSLLVISSIRLILIIKCNPSIQNPGPWQPTIFYQNVQGFIPWRDLANPHPALNTEKIKSYKVI